MSKINCYEDGLNLLITKIKIQMNKQIRKNRFLIQEIKKNEYQIKSNLLSVASNIRNSAVNSTKINDFSRQIETKRRSTHLPLKSNFLISPQKEKMKPKASVFNKLKLMKIKSELREWTIQNTNQSEQI